MSGKIEKFEDLHVWQEGMQLTKDIYIELRSFRDFGLKDQIQRASVSIPSNIAEGFEQKTNKIFIRFLYISKSSTGELRTQLYLCKDIGLINKEKCEQLIEKTRKKSAMIYNFSLIKTRKEHFS